MTLIGIAIAILLAVITFPWGPILAAIVFGWILIGRFMLSAIQKGGKQ